MLTLYLNLKRIIPILILSAIVITNINIRAAKAATTYDGDIVQVQTEKDTYLRTENIRVIAQYFNHGNEPQLLGLPAPGGLEVLVIVRKVDPKAGEANPFTGSMPATGAIRVGEHSSVALATTVIPANTLAPGLYYLDLVLTLKSATNPPQIVFQAWPRKYLEITSAPKLQLAPLTIKE